MKRLIIILLSTLSLTAFAQKKVAVYMTGEDSGVNKVFGDQLVAAFARSGKYIAVERTSSFLTELAKEHSYQRSGAVSDNPIATLGIQFGVNYVCVADISEVFGEKYVSARLIDVETAEIVNTHNVSGQMNSMNKCLQMANEIAKNLTKGTFAEQTEFQHAETLRLEQAKEQRLAELKAQGYVDLGLPSGTMWKDNNENGLYNWESAANRYGSRIPTKEQWKELYQNCKWETKGWAYKVVGPNGNYIILPLKGLYSDGRMKEVGSWGYYWTSTFCICACFLYGNSRFDFSETTSQFYYNRELSVRLIQKP